MRMFNKIKSIYREELFFRIIRRVFDCFIFILFLNLLVWLPFIYLDTSFYYLWTAMSYFGSVFSYIVGWFIIEDMGLLYESMFNRIKRKINHEKYW